MRRGRVYKRCSASKCGGTIPKGARQCRKCGGKRYSWAYIIDLAPPGAPRKQAHKSGFRTEPEATAAMSEVQSDAVAGTYVAPSRKTVGEYLVGDFLPSAKARLRPGAYDAARLHVETYIVPRIGDVPLHALRPSRVKALYAELATSGRVRGGGGLSAKTVHNVHRTLSRALTDAVSDGLLARNPAQGCHQAPETPEQPTWTAAELGRFLDHVAGDRLVAMWHVLAMTGLRRGELVGLRWRDVDLDAGRVAVSQQRAKGGGEVAAGPTKTRRSRRSIPLDPDAAAVLRTHRAAQLEKRLRFGAGWADSGLVFCRPDGSPIHPDRVTQMFRQHAAAAGLPPIRLHDVRHSYATLMLQAGVHPKVVQERLGHSSITVTMDTYSHVTPGMQEDAAGVVADAVRRARRDHSVTGTEGRGDA